MPIITSAPTQSNVDGFYYYKAQATGGVAPYTWSLVNPPLGMAIQPLPNGCAAISWMPKEIGAYEIEIAAEDCEGRKVYEKWTIAVSSKCNCNSGALAALIQDVKDMIPPVDTNIYLTEDEIRALITASLLANNAAQLDIWCQKLEAQTAEVQAIINGLDLVTEERVCELIEEKNAPVAERACVDCGDVNANPKLIEVSNLPSGYRVNIDWDIEGSNQMELGAPDQTSFSNTYTSNFSGIAVNILDTTGKVVDSFVCKYEQA